MAAGEKAPIHANVTPLAELDPLQALALVRNQVLHREISAQGHMPANAVEWSTWLEDDLLRHKRVADINVGKASRTVAVLLGKYMLKFEADIPLERNFVRSVAGKYANDYAAFALQGIARPHVIASYYNEADFTTLARECHTHFKVSPSTVKWAFKVRPLDPAGLLAECNTRMRRCNEVLVPQLRTEYGTDRIPSTDTIRKLCFHNPRTYETILRVLFTGRELPLVDTLPEMLSTAETSEVAQQSLTLDHEAYEVAKQSLTVIREARRSKHITPVDRSPLRRKTDILVDAATAVLGSQDIYTSLDIEAAAKFVVLSLSYYNKTQRDNPLPANMDAAIALLKAYLDDVITLKASGYREPYRIATYQSPYIRQDLEARFPGLVDRAYKGAVQCAPQEPEAWITEHLSQLTPEAQAYIRGED